MAAIGAMLAHARNLTAAGGADRQAELAVVVPLALRQLRDVLVAAGA